MLNTKEIDKLIEKYLTKKRVEMWHEIESYRRDKLSFNKISIETQQILKVSGIYYYKTMKKDWIDD